MITKERLWRTVRWALLIVLLTACVLGYGASVLCFVILTTPDSVEIHGFLITAGYVLLVGALSVQFACLRFLALGLRGLLIFLLCAVPSVAVISVSANCISARNYQTTPGGGGGSHHHHFHH